MFARLLPSPACPTKDSTVRVNFDLDRGEHKRLKMMAVEQGRTVAEILRELVSQSLKMSSWYAAQMEVSVYVPPDYDWVLYQFGYNSPMKQEERPPKWIGSSTGLMQLLADVREVGRVYLHFAATANSIQRQKVLKGFGGLAFWSGRERCGRHLPGRLRSGSRRRLFRAHCFQKKAKAALPRRRRTHWTASFGQGSRWPRSSSQGDERCKPRLMKWDRRLRPTKTII